MMTILTRSNRHSQEWKTHTDTTLTFDPEINWFSRLMVERFYVSVSLIIVATVFEISCGKQMHRQTNTTEKPTHVTTVGTGNNTEVVGPNT